MASERAPRKVGLVFFRNDAGTEPVRDWLKEMVEADRRAIGTDLLRAQWRWPVGMPLCRPMRKGLWEVRTDLPGNRTARVLICSHCCPAKISGGHSNPLKISMITHGRSRNDLN